MPTIHRMELPKPKDWTEFEDMVLQAMKLQWKSPNLTKNGRPGQKQEGVDIYGPDYLERPTGLQCKKYRTALTIETVLQEIRNAEAFQGKLDAVYLVTSTDHDAGLQRKVRDISSKRTGCGKFAVGVMFWEDVVNALLLSKEAFRNFYPMIEFPEHEKQSALWHLRSALEFGYYSACLKYYLEQITANNPFITNNLEILAEEFKGILRLISLYAECLLPKETGSLISHIVDDVVCAVDDRVQNDVCAALIRRGNSLAVHLRNAERYLIEREARLFWLGSTLGGYESRGPTADVLQFISLRIVSIVPGAKEKISDKISSITEGKHPYDWAGQLYNVVHNEIWWSNVGGR